MQRTMLNRLSFRPDASQVVRFLISLILAVLLWGWVTQLQDPFQTRTYTGMSIQTGGLSDDLQIVAALPTANVILKGPRSDLTSITASQLSISLDVAKVNGPGTYLLPLHVSGADNVDSVRTEPREIQVVIEQRETKIFPLTVSKTPSSGDDSRQIGQVSPSVSQVTVTGPSGSMARIAQVLLPITLSQQTAEFTGTFTPVAVDAQGQTISEVTILPTTVSADVQVNTRGKAVSVIPRIEGVPAEGYTVQQRTALPETILVDGPQDELDKLLFVNTEPVNISGATASISRRVGIEDLPEGLTIVEPANGTVEVRVAIEDITGQATEFSSLPIEVIGLGSGLEATVTPTTTNVSVLAPRSLLETMSANDIKVRVDVTGLGPGTHVLTPDVTVPQRATWLGNDPGQITVVIRNSTSIGTPVSSPSAHASPTTTESDRPTPTATGEPSPTRTPTSTA
ncbi:MAG: CdaR family protein [Thermomicrobiales bacterium]